MADADFRYNVKQYYLEIKKQNPFPQHIMSDATLMDFTIAPDTRVWLTAEWSPIFEEIKCLKHAIVMSNDIIAQLSIEQFVDENDEQGVKLCKRGYFGTQKEAEDWFLSK